MRFQKSDDKFPAARRVDFLFNDPALTEAETIANCRSVLQFMPACLWVKPCYVQGAVSELRDENVDIGTVIGCPDGSNNTHTKVAGAKRALTEGATLLAIPLNIGYIREARRPALFDDLNAVSGIAHMNSAKIEAVLNPDLLEEHEILDAARIALHAKVDVLSFPVDFADGQWNQGLFDLLNRNVGEFVTLKGLVQKASVSDLMNLFEAGFSCLGVKEILSQKHHHYVH